MFFTMVVITALRVWELYRMIGMIFGSSNAVSDYWSSLRHMSVKIGWRQKCRYNMVIHIFRVTGHLCGEFTGHRWIPNTKASDAELWCFLWCLSKQLWGWWFETLSRPLWRRCNDIARPSWRGLGVFSTPGSTRCRAVCNSVFIV